MAKSQLRGTQVKDGSIQRIDMDITTTGESVITKIVNAINTGIEINQSSGADAGTGDVSLKIDRTYLDTQYPSMTGTGTNLRPQNTFFAAPSTGGSGLPTFRVITSSDIPPLDYVPYIGADKPVDLNTQELILNGGDLKLGTNSSIWQEGNIMRTYNHLLSINRYSTSATGILSIKIPQASTLNIMTDTLIRVYSYARNFIGTIRVSFYKNSINTITARSALLEVGSAFPTETINVGIDAANNICINIGDTTTAWSSYLTFEVERFQVSHSGYNADWSNGWTYAIETDTSTYQNLYSIVPERVVLSEKTKVINTTGNATNSKVSTNYIGSSTGIIRIVERPIEFTQWGSSVVGAMVIKLPKISSIIVKGVIRNAASGHTSSFIYSAYTTTTTVAHLSDTTYINQIRRGTDASGNAYIIFNDVGTTWAYPQIIIEEVYFYSGVSSNWNDSSGYEISVLSDLTGITLGNVPFTISANQDWVESGGRTPNGSILLTTEDINTIITPGFYRQYSDSNATLVRNYPSGGLIAGSLLVTATSSTGIIQEYTTRGNSSSFRRTSDNSGNSWSVWKKIIDSEDSVATNSHSHSNKTNLDTINQDLGTTDSPSFTGLTVIGNDAANAQLNIRVLDNLGKKHISLFTGNLSRQADIYATTLGSSKGLMIDVGDAIPSGTLPNAMFINRVNQYVGVNNLNPLERLDVVGNIKATSFIKSGGTASQFLKADGSVDSNSYALGAHNHDDIYYTETESDLRFVHQNADEQMYGIKRTNSSFVREGDNIRIVKNPKSYYYNSSPLIGAFVIELPSLTGSYLIDVELSYQTSTSNNSQGKFRITGYFSSGNFNATLNKTATVIGNSSLLPFVNTIRIGSKATNKPVIILGDETTNLGSYLSMVIESVTYRYGNVTLSTLDSDYVILGGVTDFTPYTGLTACSVEVNNTPHSHSNKAHLDTINQNLGTTHSPTFNGLTVGYVLSSNRGFNSSLPFAFLNSSNAQIIHTGGVLASNAYADTSKIPTNGIYSKGSIITGGTIEIQNNQGSNSAAPLTLVRSSQVGLSFKIANVDNFLGVDASGILRYGLNASHMTNHMIWHSGNDGSGSGLDADLLDGKHASDFALSSHAHSWSQITDKPNFHTVATSGNYSDLIGTPTIPTVNNGTLTLSTGTGLSGSATFGANQGTAATFSVTVASTHKLPTTTEWDGKFNVPTGTTSQYVRGNGTLATFPTIPQGTVTSITMTVPTGLSVTGSPVTSSGTLALSYATGYQGYTTTEANKLAGIASGADNYESWTLKTDGIQRTTITSGGTLDLVAGTNVSLNYGAGGVVTINSTDTTYSEYSGTTSPGLVPARSGSTTTKFLKETGSWETPPDTTYPAGTYSNIDNSDDKVKVWTGEILKEYFDNYIETSHPANNVTNTSITNWNTAHGWGNHAGLYLPLTGGQLTGDLSIRHNPGLFQPTHEFKTNQTGGRNDFYLRADNGTNILRFTSANTYYLFDIGGGMSASNQTGFDFIQIPASNSQFRVGYYATQMPGYMSAISGNSWTGGNIDSGGDIAAGGKAFAEDGFVHNQYNDQDFALISDGSVANLNVDIVNYSGSLVIQDYFERFDINNTFNGTTNPNKLVYLVCKDTTYLEDLRPGQRIILMNPSPSIDIGIYIDDNYTYTLGKNRKVTFYVETYADIHIFDDSEYSYYQP